LVPLSAKYLFKNVLTKDRTIGAKIRAIIPFIVNPGTMTEANQSKMPFTTNENNPNVMKVIGRDRSLMMGPMKAFTNPITIAAIIAAGKLAISTPGTTISTTRSPRAVANIVNKYPTIFFLLSFRRLFTPSS
jgi:hypothetical protein